MNIALHVRELNLLYTQLARCCNYVVSMRHPVLSDREPQLKTYQGALLAQETLEGPKRQCCLPGQQLLELRVVHVLPAILKVRKSREVQSSHEDLAVQLVQENLSTKTTDRS